MDELIRVGTSEEVDSYKKIFSIDFWIEDVNRTKSDIRSAIKYSMELHGRAEEIKKGEII